MIAKADEQIVKTSNIDVIVLSTNFFGYRYHWSPVLIWDLEKPELICFQLKCD